MNAHFCYLNNIFPLIPLPICLFQSGCTALLGRRLVRGLKYCRQESNDLPETRGFSPETAGALQNPRQPALANDADLATLMQLWPTLPPHLRQGILTLVQWYRQTPRHVPTELQLVSVLTECDPIYPRFAHVYALRVVLAQGVQPPSRPRMARRKAARRACRRHSGI
jgi:hypothetical protein